MEAFTIWSLVLGILFAVILTVSSEEHVEINKKILDECKVSEGGNHEDVRRLQSFNIPTTKGAKCILACAFTRTKMLKDGHLMPFYTSKFVSHRYGHSEKTAAIVSATQERCLKIVDPDRCELANKFMQCYTDVVVGLRIDGNKMFTEW